MSDLELIDNLLIELRAAHGVTPAQLRDDSLSVAGEAIQRLGNAFEAGEVPHITLSWAVLLGKADPENGYRRPRRVAR